MTDEKTDDLGEGTDPSTEQQTTPAPAEGSDAATAEAAGPSPADVVAAPLNGPGPDGERSEGAGDGEELENESGPAPFGLLEAFLREPIQMPESIEDAPTAAECGQAQLQFARMGSLVTERMREIQAIEDRFHSNNDAPDNFLENNQHYQAGQAKIREERAIAAAELRDSGLDVKALRAMLGRGVSPIDAAMARRKPERGSQRPDFAPKASGQG